MADWFSKLGMQLNLGFHFFHDPLEEVKSMLFNDLVGGAFPVYNL